MILRELAAVVLFCTLIADRNQAQTCVGDCDSSQAVTVSEIVTGVSILLERKDIGECRSFDVNGDGRVAVNEIVAGVNSLLNDCSVGDPVDRALVALANGNLRKANTELADAITSTPSDARANLYYALTRVVVPLFDDSRIKSLIDRGQVTIEGSSADVCNIEVGAPDDVPESAPRSGEIIDTVRAILLPELNGALDNLRRIPTDVNIRFPLRYLPSCIDLSSEVDVEEVEIDHADVLALTTGFEGLVGMLELLAGYNLDASIRLAVDEPAKTLLDTEPTLLTLRSAQRLQAARDAFERALAAAIGAMDAMRAETDDQTDDALIILPEDAEDADKGRLMFNLLRDGLRGEVVLPIDTVTGEIVLMDIGLGTQERLNLNPFFSGQLQSLRPLLPAFDAAGKLDSSRFQDPTFNGIAPDLTQEKLDNFFSEADYFD